MMSFLSFADNGSKLSASRQSQSAVLRRLVGTWKLVSTQETLKNGSTRPFPQFGSHGKGFLMYQADGYMCAQMDNPDRAKPDSVIPTGGEKLTAGCGSFAYCGRYEVDVDRKQIVHLPEIASDPSFLRSRQIRPYEFDGNCLIFSDIEKRDPEVARWKIVWRKVR